MKATSEALDPVKGQESEQPAGMMPTALIPAAIVGIFLVLVLARTLLPTWAVIVPEGWIIPFIDWINAVVEFLRKVPIFFGLFTFRDLTRALATAIEWPLDLFEGILISGVSKPGHHDPGKRRHHICNLGPCVRCRSVFSGDQQPDRQPHLMSWPLHQ